jgi:hypothetical protein
MQTEIERKRENIKIHECMHTRGEVATLGTARWKLGGIQGVIPGLRVDGPLPPHVANRGRSIRNTCANK